MLRHVAGVALGLGGAAFLWSALRRKARVQAARARGEAPPPISERMAPLADIMPPLVNIGLFIAGGQVVLAWLLTGDELFSIVDLAGFLFLLVAYAIWLQFKTRYRE
jgi:hypothetical protein